jgi:hypothetical protein
MTGWLKAILSAFCTRTKFAWDTLCIHLFDTSI